MYSLEEPELLGVSAPAWVQPGTCFPLGATVSLDGINFSIFSKAATGMELVLFPSTDEPDLRVVKLDPAKNRTYFYWHVFVEGLQAGQEYAFRAIGPHEPSEGLRFDSEKLLLDPYGRAVTGWDTYDKKAASAHGDNHRCSLRSVVTNKSSYDWEGDVPLRHSFAESIIYELHVGGFTRNPNSGVAAQKRGTFAGVVEKIPYLKSLGVTAVELMPVQEFDPAGDVPGLDNYWGYSTLSFLALHHGYCVNQDAVSGLDEFRDMVKALHRAGIEVILDVVFNHTSEGDERGPTLSFRGLDNTTYYLLDQQDKSKYSNFSGCGNSFNANHPVVGRLIIDCLRYWVAEMHVDGFRFDLAAALARDVYGNPLTLPPLLWTIESDPVLAGTKLIAEAWDAAGLYRVGWFINLSNWYAEWNAPFRDDVRRFAKGDSNTISNLSARITGSPDIYVKPDRETSRSINFITCHDGFTLNDLVSYNQKHNDSNGEESRDGCDANFSWNCGIEGITTDLQIRRLRLQQMKNMLTLLFVSQGTPMLLMGDEFGRTQRGNNNAYCHDSELTWMDWSLAEENSNLLRFVRELISFTQSLEICRQQQPIALSYMPHKPYIIWHGVNLSRPDWSADSHSLAFTIEHPSAAEHLHVMLNSYWQDLDFELPALPDGVRWQRIIDTALPSPDDISPAAQAPSVAQGKYAVKQRSQVVLLAQY